MQIYKIYIIRVQHTDSFEEQIARLRLLVTWGQMQMHLHLNAFKYFFGSICIWI